MDKVGPGGACGRKVHCLWTSIIGWDPCVEKLPEVVEKCFSGWKVSTVGTKLSRRYQSRLSINTLPKRCKNETHTYNTS